MSLIQARRTAWKASCMRNWAQSWSHHLLSLIDLNRFKKSCALAEAYCVCDGSQQETDKMQLYLPYLFEYFPGNSKMLDTKIYFLSLFLRASLSRTGSSRKDLARTKVILVFSFVVLYCFFICVDDDRIRIARGIVCLSSRSLAAQRRSATPFIDIHHT